MKSYSVSFNKRSRLNKIPEIISKVANQLPPLDRAGLTQHLADTLTIQNDFFPCFDWTFPPPLLNKSEPPKNVKELFAHTPVIPDKYSIYLHSPFCKTLCSFCYYTVMPGKGIEKSNTYVDYLVREMALYAEAMQGKECESIYFGGGTPTYLDDSLLCKVFDALHSKFNIASDAEVTIESAPGTLPKEKVALLKSLGVNRLSYGIQTLDEQLLASMNRHYSVKEAIGELEDALGLISNINVDTMYGFDNEPDDALMDTLSTFHELGVPSLSIYSLDKQRDNKNKDATVPPRDDYYEHKIRLFSAADVYLRSQGYEPVLQNVYAIPDKSTYRHQVRRWDNLTLVSFGVASQGYAPRKPYQNFQALKSYYEAIDNGRLPVVTVDKLSPEMELIREVSSQLRFTEVDMDSIEKKYNVKLNEVYSDLISSLVELGYLERHGNILRMTDDASYFNNIIPMLFSPDSFTEELMGLPEEYLEAFPVPQAMTRVGRTQTEDINVSLSSIIDSSEYDRRGHIERRHIQSGLQSLDFDALYGDRRRSCTRRNVNILDRRLFGERRRLESSQQSIDYDMLYGNRRKSGTARRSTDEILPQQAMAC